MQEYLLYSMFKPEGLTYLNESQVGVPEGMLRVSGRLARLVKGQLNKNGRDYDWPSYAQGIQQIKSKINEGKGLYGELEHPPKRYTIDNNFISHKIEDINFDMNTGEVTGTFLLLDTPNGKIAQSIIKSGGAIRPSSRASGVLKGNTAFIKNMYTFDIVGSPGFEDAEMYALNESENQPLYEYLDNKITYPGLIIPENAVEYWETELCESYSVLITPPEEKIISLDEHQDNIITQNESQKEHNMNPEIKQLFEAEDFQTLLKGALLSFLVEAEEKAPTEKVVTEIFESTFQPLMESKIKGFSNIIDSWMKKEVYPLMESYMVNEFGPAIINFIEKKGRLFESQETTPENFPSYVAILQEAEQQFQAVLSDSFQLLESAKKVEDDLNNHCDDEDEEDKLDEGKKNKYATTTASGAVVVEAESKSEAVEKLKEKGHKISSKDVYIYESEEDKLDEGKKAEEKKEDSEESKDDENGKEIVESAKTIVSSYVQTLNEAHEFIQAAVINAGGDLNSANFQAAKALLESVKTTESHIQDIHKGLTQLNEAKKAMEDETEEDKKAEKETAVMESITVLESSVNLAINAHQAINESVISKIAAGVMDDDDDNKKSVEVTEEKGATTKDVKETAEATLDTASKVLNENLTTIDESVKQPEKTLLQRINESIVAAKDKSPVKQPETTLNENEDKRPEYIKKMPTEYVSIYESLNESQKNVIHQQAAIRILNDSEAIDRFWASRDFNAIAKTTNITLNESQTSNNPLTQRLKSIVSRLQ